MELINLGESSHRGGGSHHDLWQVGMFNNLALWGEKKFVSELKRTYKFQRGVNNRLDCHANQTRILSKEYSFVAGDYVRSTARNDVKRHAEDNSPKYRMVCNNVGLESPTYRNNCGEYRKTVITRSVKRRSNRIHIEKDEIATFRYTPLAMTCAGNMNPNTFSDMDFSCFTSHFSLKRAAI